MSRSLAIAAGALLVIVALPAPASAEVAATYEPVATIPIAVLNPTAGSGYEFRSHCAGTLDPATCISIRKYEWMEYRFTLASSVGGVDAIGSLMRGNGYAYAFGACEWRLRGPGVDETTTGCPASPNAPSEHEGRFRESYPAGSYTLRITCGGNCDEIWIAELKLKTYFFDFVAYVTEAEKEFFPDPGQVPTVTVETFTETCVGVRLYGSHWFRHVTWQLDWGDGSTASGGGMLEAWSMSQPPWYYAYLCHEYEFPMNTYEVCVSASDSRGRTGSQCQEVSGGFDVAEFSEQAVAYATGTVT